MVDNLNNNSIWDFDSNGTLPENLWLFKWEATNIYDYIFETDDLSCIRGGSQILDEFRDNIIIITNAYKSIKIIYNAASQFLALVQGNQNFSEKFGMEIKTDFMNNFFGTSEFGYYPLAQLKNIKADNKLVYAIHQCEEEIFRKRLTNLNIYPGNHISGNPKIDNIDNLRLADSKTEKVFREGMEIEVEVSKNTKVKFDKGKDARFGLVGKIYKSYKGRDISSEQSPFYQDLTSLSKLNDFKKGYIALISGDGNGFTEIREKIKTLKELKQFSEFIEKTLTNSIGASIDKELSEIEKGLEERKRATLPVLPVQVIYLAGDEFILIVKGSRGIEVADNIMKNFEKKCAASEIDKFKKISLSLGLVLSHCNTPIKLLVEAAKELENIAKSQSKTKKINQDYPFVIDFMTFESHPTTSDGIENYRRNYLESSDGNKLYARPYNNQDFSVLIKKIQKAKGNKFPKTQLYKIVSERIKLKNTEKSYENNCREMIKKIKLDCNEADKNEILEYLSEDINRIIDYHEIYDFIGN
ncbi:MAG: hypothetical protein HY934_00240 [Candidatus Firestonebacteria bacterium]|nr:hypothetical protein [Candidatus Firestonebacteria bacterium]